MPEIDGLFTTVENYESMTIEQLQVLYCSLFIYFPLHESSANAFFFNSILRYGN